MYSMNYIGKFISNFRDFYNEINAATLTGAIDVIVVEQPDGSYTCSPFHVRFGKLGVLRSREKVVDIEINGEPLDIHMKLGDSGEAFFVEEVTPSELGEDEQIPPHLACSPIPDDDYMPRFHNSPSRGGGATITELPDDRQEISLSRQQSSQREDTKNKDSSQGYAQKSSHEDSEAKENGTSQQPVVITAGNSVPKTFVAETVNNEDIKCERVRRISIVATDFRPISLIVEDDVPVIRNDEGGLLIDDSLDIQNAAEESSSCQEQSASLGLSRKDSSGKLENSATGEDLLKPNSSGKRKRRKKSILKKKGRKNGVGANSQPDQHELLDSTKSASEVQQNQPDDVGEQGVFQIDDVSGQPEDGSSAQKQGCSHLGGIMIGEKEGTMYSSVNCDACSKNSISVTLGTGEAARPIDTDGELARIQHQSSETDFHFFSDTEATPGCSPSDSRPCSPVQSDTEFEMKRQSKAVESGEEEAAGKVGLQGQSWRWGELPSPPPRPLLTSQNSRTSLSKMDVPDPEPVSSSDEETNKKQQEGGVRDEEDAESGNGTSLPQSPHSVEGAIGGPKSLDSDFEEPKHSDFEKESYGDICMSLCGGLSSTDGIVMKPSTDLFMRDLVTYEDLIQNPKLVENPDLVVRLNGQYYNWRTACPIIMSLVIFQKSLPQPVVDSLVLDYLPDQKDVKKPNSTQEPSRGYSSWFSWRRTSEPKKNAPHSTSDVSSPESEKLTEVKEVGTPESQDEGVSLLLVMDKKNESLKVPVKEGAVKIPGHASEVQSGYHNPPDFLDIQKEVKEEGYSGSNSSEESDEGRTKSQPIKLPIQRRSYYEHTEKYRKTLRLSSDQIASLNLNEGANEVVFSVTTAYQGTTRCKCHIYKWRFDDKVVISDIDGTITKSDVLGHILPIVGKDWAQSGVAQLFTKIKNNGYKLLYLSARAIGQARVTREYLRSIKQGDLSLPDGPLLLNPTSLISAFHREVIEKKPEEFKISCLRDIQALFPASSKPFYAGYGNKINDVWAYRAVGIPIFRIFTINHRGELKHELTQTFQSSYTNMSRIVDQMFPPPPEDTSEDFSNFIYWRDPIPDLVVDEHLNIEASKVTDDGRKKSTTVAAMA